MTPRPLFLRARGRPPPRSPRHAGSGQAGQVAVAMQARGEALLVVPAGAALVGRRWQRWWAGGGSAAGGGGSGASGGGRAKGRGVGG